MRTLAVVVMLAVLGAGLAACGQKGPLRRPEPQNLTLAVAPVQPFPG